MNCAAIGDGSPIRSVYPAGESADCDPEDDIFVMTMRHQLYTRITIRAEHHRPGWIIWKTPDMERQFYELTRRDRRH